MLIWTARGLLRTVAAMTAPCSVKAVGKYRLPPRPGFEVAICNLKRLASSAFNWNRKSAGNRRVLLRLVVLLLPAHLACWSPWCCGRWLLQPCADLYLSESNAIISDILLTSD
jgi:hypothetical protein